MKEDFVTYDIAVKLKEIGFKWDRVITYNPRTNVRYNHIEPTISQVLKWLRYEKEFFVNPSLFKDGYESFVQSTVFEDGKDYTDMWRVEGFYPTYEQAALAGIEYVLDNLI